MIKSIINWFNIAKPKPTNQDFVKQMAFHVEEFTEMLMALGISEDDLDNIKDIKYELLEIAEDEKATKKLLAQINKVALLDAMCDQVVTSIGVMEFMRADTLQALDEVNQSNYTKFSVNEQGEFVPYIRADGKIGKNPDTYREPQLEPFLPNVN